MTSRSAGLALTALLGCLVAAHTSAQDIDPETGDVILPDAPPPDDGQGSEPWYAGGPTGQAPADGTAGDQRGSSEVGPGDGSADASDGGGGQDDHLQVIEALGVGFVGIENVPIGDAVGVAFIAAPTLGVRYWFTEEFGLDVGIGIGYQGGNTSTGGTTVPQDDGFAMTLHGGVPIALFHDSHFTFEVIPELNLGFSVGTLHGAVSDDDRDRYGFLLAVGGRAGAEIQFGFMNIPNLSLLATVGLQFQYFTAGLGENRSGTVQSSSTNTWEVRTSLQGEPWDIFVGSLTAFYYFE